jgi:hypothetical protein
VDAHLLGAVSDTDAKQDLRSDTEIWSRLPSDP